MTDLSPVRQAAARPSMDRVRTFVICAMLLATIGLVPLLMWAPIPSASKEYLGPLFGFFLAHTGNLINWLIGATQKSSERSDRMAEMHASTVFAPKPVVVEAPAKVEVTPAAGDDGDDPTQFGGPRS